jgi:glycerol-3-phosphate cytidylyltransferase
MVKIITYGTFDTFHYGHLELLRRAKELGDYLIVAVSTDEFNLSKGKTSKFSFEKRVEWVKSILYVNEVIAESSWDQKSLDVERYNIDMLVMGSDWQGKFNFVKCKTVYLQRTPDVSSTFIKQLL